MFIEQEKHNDLQPKSKSFLAKKLVLFLDQKHLNAGRSEVEAVCKCAVEMLKCLKCEPSSIGGIVRKTYLFCK